MNKNNEAQILLGLNLKWYRYQMKLTQEKFAIKYDISLSYLSRMERGTENLTCKSIDYLCKILKVKPSDLLNEETAEKAKHLPVRIDQYNPEL